MRARLHSCLTCATKDPGSFSWRRVDVDRSSTTLRNVTVLAVLVFILAFSASRVRVLNPSYTALLVGSATVGVSVCVCVRKRRGQHL